MISFKCEKDALFDGEVYTTSISFNSWLGHMRPLITCTCLGGPPHIPKTSGT